MAMALPIVGALAGGFGAYALGYTSLTALTIGANIGWLVGSWAMMASMDFKNDPIDPGAHEAPRFNTAVRGAHIPILFGTNRVPAQIIWQANFETIRKETAAGGGGGKSGGSGMGGKGPKPAAQVSYEYKIDSVYHLGMSPVPLQLLGGWIGGEEINDGSIDGITTHGSTWGTSDLSEDTAGIQYDEAVFFPGDIDEDDTWAWLTSQVGQPVVWPGTAWVGFRGLSMGPQATMPQLSFEVGPAGADIDFSSQAIKRYTGNGGGDFASGIDKNLTTYSSPSRAQDVNGTTLWSIDTDTAMSNLMASQGIPVSGSSSAHASIMSPDGEYVYHFLCELSDEPDTYYLWIAVSAVPAEGEVASPTFLGYMYYNIGLQIFYPKTIGRCHNLTGDWSYFLTGYDYSAGDLWVYQIPTPQELINFDGSHAGIDGATLNANQGPRQRMRWTHSSGDWMGDNVATHRSGGWVTSESPMFFTSTIQMGLMGPEISRKMWFVMNKADMNSAASSDYGLANNKRATHPDGGLWYIDLGEVGFAETWTGTTFSSGSTGTIFNYSSDAADGNSDWVDTDGVTAALPIEYDGEKIMDGGTPSGAWPVVSHQPATYLNFDTLGIGVPVVIFGTIDADSAYTTTYGAASLAARAVAYYWNATTSKFQKLGEQKGLLLQQGDLDYSSWNINAAWDNVQLRVDSQLDIYFQVDRDGSAQDSLLAKFGALDFGSTDVTPPYIIRQILVNEVFGLDPGNSDLIDSDSYADAVTFCETNGILVSTQYRRAGGALQHIEMLLAIYGGWLSVMPSTGKIKFGVMDLQNQPIRTLDNSHLVIREEGEPPVKTTKGAQQDTYNIIRVNFIDRELHYENNQAEARDEVDEDLHGPRIREFPPDFVMSKATAEWMADRALWTNLYVKDAHQFYLGWKDSDLEPGDIVTLVDSFSGLNQVVQIATWKEVDRGVYDVTATQQVPGVSGYIPSQISSSVLSNLVLGGTSSNSVGYLTGSGTVVYSGIVTNPMSAYDTTGDVLGPVPAPRHFQAYELPAEFNTTPGVYINWMADAMAYGATLYVSPDGASYAPMLQATPYPLAGTILTELPGNPDQVFAEGVELLLLPKSGWTSNSPSYMHNTTLADVSAAGMHAGAGLLYIGSEMLAFTNLTQLGQNRYRAARVYRGWGGTHVHAHNSGDVWVKHGSGIFYREYDESQIGNTFYYKVAPFNSAGYEYNVASISAKSYTIKGTAYRPQIAPAINFAGNRRNRRVFVGSECDIPIDWQDSARKSGYGAGGFGTAPGGFGGFTTDPLSHSWRVVVVGSGGTVVRSTVVTTPNFTYTSSMNFADNGAWRGNVAFNVTPFSPYGDAPQTTVLSLELYF